MSYLPPDGSPVPPWAGPFVAVDSTRRGTAFDAGRLAATAVLTAIIALVVLGGIGLDGVIAAPSAGTVAIGGSVTMAAAPGWVLAPSQSGTASGIELRKADATLTAEVVSSGFTGGSGAILAVQERSLSADAAQISFGDPHTTTIGGHDTTDVLFEANVMSDHGSGIIDGELACLVVGGDAVVVMVGAPQGDLDPVSGDVSDMLASIGAGQ